MSRRTAKQVVYDLLQTLQLRRAGVAAPTIAEVDSSADQTLFIGPANSAGQGTAWARAVESYGTATSATSMMFQRDARFGFDVDQAVPSGYGAHSRRWQRQQFASVSNFTAVICESGRPLFGSLFGGDPITQYRALVDRGVRIALLFHGSDIRDPDRHLAAEPDSHFLDADFARTFREVTARNRALAATANVPVFVSTPDLLVELEGSLPDVRWLPVVITPEQWVAPAPPMAHGGPLRVVHIPSSTHIKGTDLIEPELHELARVGTIEYRSVAGVPHAQMPTAYRSADVVLDQFRAGIYGVAACEALAAGRLVVSHVSESTRERTRQLTGEELPIVEATVETLPQVLTDIKQRPDHYAYIAAQGPGFVNRHHDGSRSGQILTEWMRENHA